MNILKISHLRPRFGVTPTRDSHPAAKINPWGLAEGIAEGLRAASNRFLGQKLVSLANSEPDKVALVSIANEVELGEDGWACLAKYGDWPHEKGVQRFGREQADQMVGYFRNGWNRMKRFLVGSPIFKGHPDVPAFANVSRDKTVYGTTTDLQARDDGIYFRPVITEAGLEVIKKGAKFVSAHWLANQLPDENGKKVFAPIYLVSVGLTATPNIPGPALTNESPEISPMNKQLVIQLLAAMGVHLANEADDAATNAALTQASEKAKALVARPEASALANEQSARSSAEQAATAAKTDLANERKARIKDHLDQAITAGRIAEADRPVWEGRLSANFETESKALANEAVKFRKAPADVSRTGDAASASAKFQSLVNEAMKADKTLSYDAAWTKVKCSAEGKALQEKMSAKS